MGKGLEKGVDYSFIIQPALLSVPAPQPGGLIHKGMERRGGPGWGEGGGPLAATALTMSEVCSLT